MMDTPGAAYWRKTPKEKRYTCCDAPQFSSKVRGGSQILLIISIFLPDVHKRQFLQLNINSNTNINLNINFFQLNNNYVIVLLIAIQVDETLCSIGLKTHQKTLWQCVYMNY